jgi:hypothetical protein
MTKVIFHRTDNWGIRNGVHPAAEETLTERKFAQ